MCIKEKSRSGQESGIAAKGQIKFTKKDFEIKYSVALIGEHAVLGVEWDKWKGHTVLDNPKRIDDTEYVQKCAYELAKGWILNEAQKYAHFKFKPVRL